MLDTIGLLKYYGVRLTRDDTNQLTANYRLLDAVSSKFNLTRDDLLQDIDTLN
ncbi:hypothetical protein BCEN4_420004 [Burkholderia cenocepacia]|nr:hypothetical protein BCEN4_420004 [Burkholderia cenocepacia]